MRATAARPNRFQYVFLYRQKRRSVTAISFDAGESYRETARVYISSYRSVAVAEIRWESRRNCTASSGLRHSFFESRTETVDLRLAQDLTSKAALAGSQVFQVPSKQHLRRQPSRMTNALEAKQTTLGYGLKRELQTREETELS